jgi:hypothetical protein
MARDRYFSLEVDVNKPSDNVCKKRKAGSPDVPADPLDKQEFLRMLDNGSLTAVGFIFSGDLTPIAEKEAAGYTAELEPLGQKCIVVYLGGTAYRICT